jgi:phospholipase D1/2
MTKQRFSPRIRGVLLLLAMLGCAAAWHWTPLNQWVRFETVAAWQQSFKADPAALYIIVGAYLLGGFVLFPITLLTAATIFTFGPVAGNTYALIGWLLSAALGYGIGRVLGQDWLRSIAGDRLSRLDREANRRGLWAVLALRILPVAPFTVVNLFIGASRIRFCDFVLGSVLGRIPGLLALTLFEVQLKNLLHAPAIGAIALMAFMLLFLFWAQRWLVQQLVTANQPIASTRKDIQA